MREPHKFPRALTGVMAFLLSMAYRDFLLFIFDSCVVLFGGAGALGYLTFGEDIQAVVLVNLDGKSKTVQAVCSVVSRVSEAMLIVLL